MKNLKTFKEFLNESLNEAKDHTWTYGTNPAIFAFAWYEHLIKKMNLKDEDYDQKTFRDGDRSDKLDSKFMNADVKAAEKALKKYSKTYKGHYMTTRHFGMALSSVAGDKGIKDHSQFYMDQRYQPWFEYLQFMSRVTDQYPPKMKEIEKFRAFSHADFLEFAKPTRR
jgi:hypothetical protein